MKRPTITLILLAIPLVLAGRYATSWQSRPVACSVTTDDGDRIDAIAISERLFQIWRTDSRTGQNRRLASSRRPFLKILIDDPRRRLFALDYAKLRVIATQRSRDLIPPSIHNVRADQAHLLLDTDLDVVVLIAPKNRSHSMDDQEVMHLYRSSSGDLLHSVSAGSIDRLTFGDSQLICRCDDRTIAIRMRDEDGELLTAYQIETEEPRKDSLRVDARAWDRSEPDLPNQNRAPIADALGNLSWPSSQRFVALLSVTIAALTVAWLSILIPKHPDQSPAAQGYLDLAMLFGLLLLLGIPIGTEYFDASENSIRTALPISVALATVQSIGFLLLLRMKEQRHLWIAVFAACAFPPLIFTLILAFLVRRLEGSDRTEIAGGIRFRFGIQDMLLATAAVAILMQLGRQSLFFFWFGLYMSLHLGVAYFVARRRTLSWTTVLLGVPIIAWIITSQQLLGRTASFCDPLLYFTLVLLAFAFLGVYGNFDLRRTPGRATPLLKGKEDREGNHCRIVAGHSTDPRH
jgi:hypothetical protein